MDWTGTVGLIGLVVAAIGSGVAVSAELRARRVERRFNAQQRRERFKWALRSEPALNGSDVRLRFVNEGTAPAHGVEVNSDDLRGARVTQPGLGLRVPPGEALEMEITRDSDLPGSVRLCWRPTLETSWEYEEYVKTDDWLPVHP